MGISGELLERCGGSCELCGHLDGLSTYIVSPRIGDQVEDQIAVCATCSAQLHDPESLDDNHWRCLNESIWHEVDAVKVVSSRMLHRLKSLDWAQDLMSMMYMDEVTQEWAEQGLQESTGAATVHKDSNGNILQSGDTVTLIKDLNVKGANFVAKRGTAVRRISLVADNHEHIQGRVNDQTIIILTKFVKK